MLSIYSMAKKSCSSGRRRKHRGGSLSTLSPMVLDGGNSMEIEAVGGEAVGGEAVGGEDVGGEAVSGELPPLNIGSQMGGMGAADHALAVYGSAGEQQAVSAGSNVIAMKNPYVGGRKSRRSSRKSRASRRRRGTRRSKR